MSEECSGEGEEGEADDVEYKGRDNAFRVRGILLEFSEEEHGAQVRDSGDRDYTRLEVSQDPGRGGEARLEVRSGCEEHVPGVEDEYVSNAGREPSRLG